jgi:antitoxin (DNA-binding transcriptional repressor) of toxin-antitoxin stability system
MKTRATAKHRIKAKTPASGRTGVSAETLVPTKPAVPAKTHVTATEAARKFSEILNRVAYKGESFVVERSGRPVCEISPPEKRGISTHELVEILRSGPHPDKGYFDILEEITRNQPTVAPLPWER